MIFPILLVSLLSSTLSAVTLAERYAGEWGDARNAAISKALEFMPRHSPIRAELEQRRAQVYQIWDTTKMLNGEQWRVISILYSRGYGMYETRWYKRPVNQAWYARIRRLFKPRGGVYYEALS